MPDVRVALDTNVWAFLTDRDEAQSFARWCRSRGITVVVPPATLLEISRTKDPIRRARILAAATTPPRIHPRTEAAEESAEFIEEIRRLRPSWIREKPIHVADFESLDRLWTRRVPRFAKYKPDVLGEMTRTMESGRLEYEQQAVVDSQRSRQDALRAQGREVNLGNLHDTWVSPADGSDPAYWTPLPLSGRIEEWRFQNAVVFWSTLQQPATYGRTLGRDTTRADWIEPFVDLGALRRDHADFNRLWFEEIAPERVLRNWLRWALQLAQVRFRLGRGNATDEQQAAYLPDCDVYATADHRFHLALEAVCRQAPRSVAKVVYVDRNASSAVAAIEVAISAV
ncbi:MAG: hypothetical protein AB1627_03220 [Chloroflexota bacterium]